MRSSVGWSYSRGSLGRRRTTSSNASRSTRTAFSHWIHCPGGQKKADRERAACGRPYCSLRVLLALVPAERALTAALQPVQRAAAACRANRELRGALDGVTRLQRRADLDRDTTTGANSERLDPSGGRVQLTRDRGGASQRRRADRLAGLRCRAGSPLGSPAGLRRRAPRGGGRAACCVSLTSRGGFLARLLALCS